MQTTYATVTECTEAIDYREVLTPKNLFTIDRRARTDLLLMEQSGGRGVSHADGLPEGRPRARIRAMRSA